MARADSLVCVEDSRRSWLASDTWSLRADLFCALELARGRLVYLRHSLRHVVLRISLELQTVRPALNPKPRTPSPDLDLLPPSRATLLILLRTPMKIRIAIPTRLPLVTP